MFLLICEPEGKRVISCLFWKIEYHCFCISRLNSNNYLLPCLCVSRLSLTSLSRCIASAKWKRLLAISMETIHFTEITLLLLVFQLSEFEYRCQDWTAAVRLLAVTFASHRCQHIPKTINDEVIPHSNTAKCIGMALDTKRRWKAHVK